MITTAEDNIISTKTWSTKTNVVDTGYTAWKTSYRYIRCPLTKETCHPLECAWGVFSKMNEQSLPEYTCALCALSENVKRIADKLTDENNNG